MLIQVAVDESGGMGQGPLFVFAATSLPAQQWAVFSEKWSACLAEPPAIAHFHMREAVSRSGEFSRWPVEDRDQKLKALIAVINQFPMRLLPFGILVDDFAKTLAAVAQKPLDQPYFWSYQFLIWFAARDLYDTGQRERFEIFFDVQKIFGHQARAWYPLTQHIIGSVDPEAASILPNDPMFRDDKEFLPLQSADLLAWLVRRHLSGDSENNPLDWIRREFRSLIMSPLRCVLSEDTMRVIALRMTNSPVIPADLVALYKSLYG